MCQIKKKCVCELFFVKLLTFEFLGIKYKTHLYTSNNHLKTDNSMGPFINYVTPKGQGWEGGYAGSKSGKPDAVANIKST